MESFGRDTSHETKRQLCVEVLAVLPSSEALPLFLWKRAELSRLFGGKIIIKLKCKNLRKLFGKASHTPP
ncbi:hypothetical protein CVD28_11240 [Bacillus sp. M6-12]|nr:hypothetical protein CVD28_11240 [Bacillus sp. M6-12]